VVKGLTGYEMTNPITLAVSILVHYREYGNHKFYFDGDFWKALYRIDERIHDEEGKNLTEKSKELVKKSVDAGDLFAEKLIKRIMEET
jgi:hypothetical protein